MHLGQSSADTFNDALQLFWSGRTTRCRTQASRQHGLLVGKDHVKDIARHPERNVCLGRVLHNIGREPVLHGLHIVTIITFKIYGSLGNTHLAGMSQNKLLHPRHHGRLFYGRSQFSYHGIGAAGILLGRDTLVPVYTHQHVAVSHLGQTLLSDDKEQSHQTCRRHGIYRPHDGSVAEEPL